MEELFWARILAYSALPLLLAWGHIFLSRRSMTPARRVETVIMYLLAMSVGASGLGGAVGHLFLSDVVAEGIGWPMGSPFQLEMGFVNLALGVLGLAAVSERGGFRTATILAVTIVGVGATIVHLVDIAQSGNLAPGNTIQNIANLLDPALLIALTAVAARISHSDVEGEAFLAWHRRQQPILALAALGVGVGFGIGYAIDLVMVGTVSGTLVGVAFGWLIAPRAPHESAHADSSQAPARRVTTPVG